MKNYKETLNLPNTAFPMKANLAQREPEILDFWEENNLYQKIRKKNNNNKNFILHDGPPYANGDIHIGHAVNKILKDIIIKSKGFSGLNAPYVPGWDCHGLPIELQVEKKIGKAGIKVEPKVFRDACREFASKQVDKQRIDFKRLGVLGDWENPYLTMDYSTEANIIRALGKIINTGHLHQGVKPVHWCIDCCSALAEAEVEYNDKQSPAIDVRFPLVECSNFLKQFNIEKNINSVSIVVWTTTPWTLPANQAVALHPENYYALVQVSNEILIIANELYETVLSRCGFTDYKVLSKYSGSDFEGLKLKHPFYDRTISIVLGDHVTLETGTGAVHIAPGHGQDDYIVGQRYNLVIDNPVADNGCFVTGTELFAGEHVFKANNSVISILEKNKNLLKQETIQHSYPHCWRHKTPIIFRATPQWFISMDSNGLRNQALDAIKKVDWQPSWGKERIFGMIENRPDWCISRQRTWGVPIPVFIHRETQELHPETSKIIKKVAELVEQKGINAWFDLDSAEILNDDSKDYIKVMDTLDVWFDSGVTHDAVLHNDKRLDYPADLYLEGSDQHRGWFQSALLTSLAITRNEKPYRSVVTHGFTVDANGLKMSKSKGNVIAPQKIMNVYGADILRLWVAATDYRAEMNVSDEILKRVADAYRRIRNTSRYLLSNLNDFDPKENSIDFSDMLDLDKWIIEHALSLQKEIITAYDNFEFHLIYQLLHQFCVVEMGGFYLDIIKDRQYTTSKDSLIRRSGQTAMYHLVQMLVRWLAPVISYTADEIWKYIPGDKDISVFLEDWYEIEAEDINSKSRKFRWEKIILVRDEVNKQLEKLRSDGTIGSSLDAEVNIYCNEEFFNELNFIKDELRFVLICSSTNIYPLEKRNNDAIQSDISDLFIYAKPYAYEKCVRCWHRHESIGKNDMHKELCSRCISNISQNGEIRLYA